MNWSNVIAAVEAKTPFLSRIGVTAGPLEVSPLPSIIKIVTAMGFGLAESPVAPLAIMLPQRQDAARWAALGAAFAAVRRGFDASNTAALEKLSTYASGTQLLLDGNKVVELDSVEDGYIWVAMRNKNWIRLPATDALRLQAAGSKRKIAEVRRSVFTVPPNVLDRLLGINAYGNRAIVEGQVILVSTINRSVQWCREMSLLAYGEPDVAPICDLLRFGQITRKGQMDILSAGQMVAEPSLLFASDLIGVRDYLREHRGTEAVVIVDGGAPLRGKLDVIDQICNLGRPILSFLEQTEFDELQLAAAQMEAWVWGQEDLRVLAEGEAKTNGVFGAFNDAVEKYAERRVDTVECCDGVLEPVFAELESLKHRLKQVEYDADKLQSCVFSFLLSAARLAAPLQWDESSCEHFETHLAKFDAALQEVRPWLSPETREALSQMREGLARVMERDDTQVGGKLKSLLALIRDGAPEKVTVIVSEEWEKTAAEGYVYERLRHDRERVRFLRPRELDGSWDQDHLIVCGWLGHRKMEQLLEGCLARHISLLLYPFERPWYASYRRKRTVPEASAARRAQLLGISVKDIPSAAAVTSPAALAPLNGTAGAADVEANAADFEIILRRRSLSAFSPSQSASAGPAVASVETRLVLFYGNRYAHLPLYRPVPVATDWIEGTAAMREQMPLRRVSELNVGDYIVFREGRSESLIRELADLGLRKSGRSQARQVASLWRGALGQFRLAYPPNRSGLAQVVAALRAGGVGRHESTIRGWLHDDYDIIGPRHMDDLTAIATVTRDAVLCDKLGEVRAAISEVWGAHQQAAHLLAEQLQIAVEKGLPKAGGGDFFRFQVAGVGSAVVVRVEDIDTEVVPMPWSHVNRLYEEN